MRDDYPRIARVEGMPRPRRRKVRVFRPAPGECLTYLIVNSRPVPLMVHWDGKKQRLHWEPASSCEFCQQKQTPYYTSYLGVWSVRAATYGLVEVTENAARHESVLGCDDRTDLRGMALTLERATRSRTGPIKGRLIRDRETQYLPLPYHVTKALETLFDVPEGTLAALVPDEHVVFPADDEPVAADEDPETAGL